MKQYIYILSFILLFTNACYSQAGSNKSFDVGILLGGSYYIGDLNPTQHFGKYTKPAGGIVARYNFSRRFATRISFLIGSIEAHDAYSKSLAQQQRNLNFRSMVQEFSGQMEFNFLEYKIGGKPNQSLSPYIFAGVALFHYNPEAEVNNGWVELRDLGTEGQGLYGDSEKPYKLTRISIPFGVGFKTNFSKGIGISFEWGMRRTFTDYLDDVSTVYYDAQELERERGLLASTLSDRTVNNEETTSNIGKQRGNAQTKDWYSFFGIILSLKLVQTKGCIGALNIGEY